MVDFTEVPFLDSSAARMIVVLAHKLARMQVRLFLTGTNPDTRRTLVTFGLRGPGVKYCGTIAQAVSQAHRDRP